MEPLFEKLKSNAIAKRQRIVLPESTEPRTLTAADRIIADGIADVVFIGDKAEIMAKASELGLNNIDKAITAARQYGQQEIITVNSPVMNRLIGRVENMTRTISWQAETVSIIGTFLLRKPLHAAHDLGVLLAYGYLSPCSCFFAFFC